MYPNLGNILIDLDFCRVYSDSFPLGIFGVNDVTDTAQVARYISSEICPIFGRGGVIVKKIGHDGVIDG